MKRFLQRLSKWGIDLAPLGIERRTDAHPYFCTPRGADIFGWAGVDGIHFCFVRGFGETVFAVSPMNEAPHFVHPLARNGADFLRLLLACGDSAALEQAWQWDEAQFDAYLAENPPSPEQEAVLRQIAERTGLSPMEHPWRCLRELQASFDYARLKYTEDYYDPEMNPDAPCPEPEWNVFYGGSFWGQRGSGRPGTEMRLHRVFAWAGRSWLLPSVYLCAKGIVADFCFRTEQTAIRAFLDKWQPDRPPESEEERLQMELDNPLELDFTAVLRVNGRELRAERGCSIAALPPAFPEGAAQEAERIAAHYRLDRRFGWTVHRLSFPWATKRKPPLRSLSVTMMQEPVSLPGPHFRVSRPGDAFSFSSPTDGKEHLLTVQEYEAQTVDWSRMPERGLERPSHYLAMTYTVAPELPDGVLSAADCCDGDRPRQAKAAPGQPQAVSCAVVIGVIGGADGPTAILFGPKEQGKLHAACSSLYFEPVENVTWRLCFRQKQFDDAVIELLPKQEQPAQTYAPQETGG